MTPERVNPSTGGAAPPAAEDADALAVFTTLNPDGSRKWIHPRVSPGRFINGRRAAAYALIALFAALPAVRVNGNPLVLLDIPSRRFHILGSTFYPTDTLLLALLLVSVFLTIFWFTALLGRLWCGWACPQTVYMEFLFRPIERLFEGAPGRAKHGLARSRLARPLKLAVYLACSLVLAHMFLAYFVSWDRLRMWMIGAPWNHPIGFGVVVTVTAAMMFDFAYFREQLCLVACPYGRMQSVMLDRHSLIVGYDAVRGEPRGAKKVSLPVVGESKGDCIDCRMCVTTCPTGIDIRNGLQMECIGCAQCIDACDTVMDKIERPRGLIRYSSQAAMRGEKFKMLRPRVVVYPAVITVLASLFAFVLVNTGMAEVTVLRGLGQPFTVVEGGEVRNGIQVKLLNRSERAQEFRIGVEGVEGARLTSESAVFSAEPNEWTKVTANVYAPEDAFAKGRARCRIVVEGPEGFRRVVPFTLLGPSEGHEEHRP